MTPIRYSLHYEDYSEHLMSRFGKLLQMQSLVDMTLMCSSHTLRVHKAVLAASSAYFQEVLQKQMGEPLIILKMRFSVLKCLVEFMYCGKTQCLEEHLDELVSAAQFLKIKGLSKVTKEGLGIANTGELPVFTPPVVINRPPKSLIDQNVQDNNDHNKAGHSQLTAVNTISQPIDGFGRPNKPQDTSTLVRIPFDIENNTGISTAEYPDLPRSIKPRRGRPSVRRPGGWDGPGSLSRAAERALLRREQDSRKAIHQLKHLQTRHMQDYMDRVTLSQAVNSICGPESSNSYMNMNNEHMYMNQNVSNVPFKDNITDITPSYSNTNTTNSVNDSNGDGISTAMSQYVNALKSAGLPTDLPILFESGDGSYINVNEQVLLDMVQSSEIQYEVIEQPNIIEKVADPSEIKSIDDLSKSIERGEMMLNNKVYSQNDYNKDSTQFNRPEDEMTSLNNILTDNLESFGEHQNYVVLDRLQDNNNPLDNVSSNDFACIDGDMQFFTKSMSDDVKKYYQDQQLADARVMEQLCPTSSSLDANFNMALLDSKSSQMNDSLSQQFSSLNSEAMRRSEDCYDFSLQLPQSNEFKDDLDCLIATPRRNDDDNNSFAQAKEEIIKDLMSIESKMKMSQEINSTSNDNDGDMLNAEDHNKNATVDNDTDLSTNISTSGLQWEGLDINDEPCQNNAEEISAMNNENHENDKTSKINYQESAIDLNPAANMESQSWDSMRDDCDNENKENETPTTNDDILSSDLENDIPYAVGLLPLKHTQQTEEPTILKRKHAVDLLDSEDAKCLKRKAKKKM